MAGSIPQLISSSPPPLNAFDDDEEEDEDEFGGYAVAEDLDYNECISFKENNDGKEKEIKSKREQDNSSQDSATDSGLCPDSEGMSPTPHSDDERVKIPAQMFNGHSDAENQNSSGKLNTIKDVKSLTEVPITNGFHDHSNGGNADLKAKPIPSFQSVPQEEITLNEEFDADFGNFEFASTSSFQTRQDKANEDNAGSVTELKSTYDSFLDNTQNVIENRNLEEEERVAEGECDEDKFQTPNGPNACDDVDDDEDFLPFDNNLDFVKTHESALDQVNCDFKESNNVPSESSQLQNVNKIDIETSLDNGLKSNCLNSDNDFDDDEFDDFTDFKANFPNSDIPESEHSEFSEHSKSSSDQVQRLSESCIKSSQNPHQNDASDDEFSNFADFSSSDCAFVSAQSSNSAENSSYIPVKPIDNSDLRTDCDFQDWVSVFPPEPATSAGDSCVTLLPADDAVWTRLMPLESSPAFNYHWTDSLSNRSLLKALSIDSRNILWGVPRFAANLNCGVLQPVKAMEPLQPAPVVPQPLQPQPQLSNTNAHLPPPETVPDAHFDWGSSGLTNPLDCPKPPVLNLPKTLSAEAEKILSLIPDLSYMRKSYIVFPITEGR